MNVQPLSLSLQKNIPSNIILILHHAVYCTINGTVIIVWVWMVCSLHSVTTGSRDRANVSLIIIIIINIVEKRQHTASDSLCITHVYYTSIVGVEKERRTKNGPWGYLKR